MIECERVLYSFNLMWGGMVCLLYAIDSSKVVVMN